MFVKEGAQGTAILATQLVAEVMLGDRLLHKDGIDEHQAVLQELQRQGGDFVLLATVRRQIPCRP